MWSVLQFDPDGAHVVWRNMFITSASFFPKLAKASGFVNLWRTPSLNNSFKHCTNKSIT